MSSASSGSGPSHSHHETSYGGYTNRGYHASEGGIININQTNYQFKLPDTLGMGHYT